MEPDWPGGNFRAPARPWYQSTMLADLKAQLHAMCEGLNVPAAEVNVKDVVPVLVPASFFESGNWPGPFTKLRSREIALTWTVLMPQQTMRYVDFAMQQHWESKGLDWREQARQNLAERSQNSLGLGQMRRTNGQVYAISCMFEDGMGPSRLLFRGTLKQMFPEGYQVAMPERSCGLAFSNTVSDEERKVLVKMMEDCFLKGTRPFVRGSFDPDDLLPEE
jgi:hypothetical protein